MIEDFFELGEFAHAALFSPQFHPWTALDRLDAYLNRWLCEFCDHKSRRRIESAQKAGAFVEKPELIWLGPQTRVEPGAYLRGPLIVGANCQIRHSAYLRGSVIAGDHCVIGHASEIKHSILLNGAKAAHFAYLGDSILGRSANLGAGAKCANLRLDGAVIWVHYGGQKISTHRRKFGSLVGDEAQIGCNSVLNPGCLVTKGARVYPCRAACGTVTRPPSQID